MVGGTADCLGVEKKKSKDRCILIEVSQTSPVTFDDTDPTLTEQPETHLVGKKKKKKKKKSDNHSMHDECRPSTTSHGLDSCVVTVDNPDLIIAKVTQEDGGHNPRQKKKTRDKKLPEQEKDLTGPETDTLENVKKVNQDCSEGVPELTKRKKRHRKIRSIEPEMRGEDSATAQPTEYNTDQSLETATVTTAQHCIPLRCGRFTETENRRLNENVLDFLALTGIESPTHLFYPDHFKTQKTLINKLKKDHKFHERIAEGIPRPWHHVYIRGRKMFHEYQNKGMFSMDELRSLKKLQTLHGNNWAIISSLMDRSNVSLEKRFSQIASQKGSWSLEETKRLMEAMKEVLQTLTAPELQSQTGEKFIQKDKLINGIPWKHISQVVETRSWTQCRVKWMCVLKRKMMLTVQTQNRKKDIQAKVDLIKRLYERKVEDVADVDWEELATASGNVTPYHVQKLFFRLKVTRVPLWKNMSFCDIVDFLYDQALPVLESMVKDLNVTADVDLSERPHNHFLLSEIFKVDTEEETEVDNTI